MPIYEYACSQCDHRLDALQKLSDPPLTECPQCHEVALRRLISAPSFRLKGSGWYETDFKQDRRRNLADSGDGAASDGKDKADAKQKPDGDGNGAAKPKVGHNLDGPRPEKKSGEKKSGEQKSGGHDHGHGHGRSKNHGHSHGHDHKH